MTIFAVSASPSFTRGCIFKANETLILSVSPVISQGAYSWSSDPASLLLVAIFVLIFLLSVIIAWRSPEREQTTQTRRLQSTPAILEVPVEPFVNALKSTDWEARRDVVSVLGNIGSESAVDPLIGVLLHDENDQVRELAASWLGRIGGEKAVVPLVMIVKNYLASTEHSTNVVFTSVTALGQIGSMQGLSMLKKLAESLGQSGATDNINKVSRAIKDIEQSNDLTDKKCIVCNLPLGKGGELVQCPFCKNVAHREHMLGWLSGREYCPTCGKPIKESQLVQVRRRVPASRLTTEPETKKD